MNSRSQHNNLLRTAFFETKNQLFSVKTTTLLNFEEIYDEHKDKVFNLALNYTQNYQDAEELTQDVFVSVYESLADFKQQSKISTWIYRITINKSLDFIKAKNRKKRLFFFNALAKSDLVENEIQSTHFNHPGTQLEDKEALIILFKHINHLPSNQKTALILSKIEQKPQLEIAEIMNISQKAVESLVQRAKTGLLKKINKNEG